ncbi:MAG TPA: hypothetical protein VNT02_00240 [Burkholderiales bacterium]|nr:hypothetical protein [Burkholderiales bacterium]
MSTHAAVETIVEAINSALGSIAVGDYRNAVTRLAEALPLFGDSRYSSSTEVWQLFDPFMAVVTVCASAPFQNDGNARGLFADAVRMKLNRIRP